MFRRAHLGFVLPIVAGLTLTACGDSTAHGGMNMGSSSPATRTIDVEMTDLAFRPSSIAVQKGETIKFVFTNNGKIQHDAFIGDQAEQMQHGMQMSGASKGMKGHAMDGLTVMPGKMASTTTSFPATGMLEIGCHEPGHYEAGMKVVLTVA